MKPNELRIGNLVIDENDDACQIANGSDIDNPEKFDPCLCLLKLWID